MASYIASSAVATLQKYSSFMPVDASTVFAKTVEFSHELQQMGLQNLMANRYVMENNLSYEIDASYKRKLSALAGADLTTDIIAAKKASGQILQTLASFGVSVNTGSAFSLSERVGDSAMASAITKNARQKLSASTFVKMEKESFSIFEGLSSLASSALDFL